MSSDDQDPAGLPEQDGLAAMVHRLAKGLAAVTPRVAGVEVRVEDLAEAIDVIEDAFAQLAAAGPGLDAALAAPTLTAGAAQQQAGDEDGDDEDGDDGGGLDMRVLVPWVGANIAWLIERRVPHTGGVPHWCRKWWLHPEAIARFEALRRTWAASVTEEGAAMVIYFEHVDAMLNVLCGENGPFSGCTGGDHGGGRAGALQQDTPGEDYFSGYDEPASSQLLVPGHDRRVVL